LVSLLLIKYCSGKKIYTVAAQKRAQPPWAGFKKTYSGENYEWSQ
jgi:hypothetical protein